MIAIFCSATSVSAQKITADNVALTKFEKSIEQGNYSTIERDLLNYAIAHPNDAKAFELLARLRFGQNRLNQAKSLYQKALSLDPNLTSAEIDLAVVNFQTGNAGQAVSDLSEISGKDISNDALRIKLANAFALVGNCQNAIATVEKLSIKYKNDDALPLRADCYIRTGEKGKIDLLIPLAKNLIEKNPAIAVEFAEKLTYGAMYKESADVLRLVIKSSKNNAAALILLAKSEIYLKDLPNAKVHLEQAAKIKPDSSDLFFIQSLLESEKGNFSEAMDLLEKSIAVNPNSTTVLSQFVITAMRANQAGKAAKIAEKLVGINPDEPEFVYLYGASSLQSNNLQTAETALNRFAELRPNDSRGCLALGLNSRGAARKNRRCTPPTPALCGNKSE